MVQNNGHNEIEDILHKKNINNNKSFISIIGKNNINKVFNKNKIY